MNTKINVWLSVANKCFGVAALVATTCVTTPAFSNPIFVSGTSPVTLGTTGVVGAAAGLAGDDPNNEIVIAQNILNLMGLSATTTISGRNYYNSTAYDYSALLTNPLKIDSTTGVVSTTGYNWAIGKYDNQSAGYILFYIGGLATDLPDTSASIFPNLQTGLGGYDISHYTLFRSDSDVPGVPEGGSTLALLGAAFGLLGLVRSRIRLIS